VRDRLEAYLAVKAGMAFYQLAAPEEEEEETDMIVRK
jgi:hypothetical protein